MAVIKYGSIVTGGSGSLGGSTLQHGHSGNIWRNKPQQTYSRTSAQALIRGYNKTMQAGWRTLTDQDRKVWNDFAQTKPVFNRSGEKHAISGHSLWMKYQFDALSKGAEFMPDPSWYPGPYLGKEMLSDPGFDNPPDWSLGPLCSIAGSELFMQRIALGNTFCSTSTEVIGIPHSYRIETHARLIVGNITTGNGNPPWTPVPNGIHVYTLTPPTSIPSFYIYLKNIGSGYLSYVSCKQYIT